MLFGSKLGRDTVHLDKDPGLAGGIPREGDLVQLIVLLAHLADAVAQRHVHLQYPLVGMTPGPLGNLLALDVLQPALVEADADRAAQPLLLVVAGQVPELLHLELVALALVDVGQRGLTHLCGYTSGRGQHVLKAGVKVLEVLNGGGYFYFGGGVGRWRCLLAHVLDDSTRLVSKIE